LSSVDVAAACACLVCRNTALLALSTHLQRRAALRAFNALPYAARAVRWLPRRALRWLLLPAQRGYRGLAARVVVCAALPNMPPPRAR
jgi:hypothetical protein